ncbi:MAG: hypothetical protein WBC44_09400 [Planctomycetaceae bacterium]
MERFDWGYVPTYFLNVKVSMPDKNMFFYELETPISGGKGFLVEKERESSFKRGEVARPLHINVTSKRHQKDGFHLTWKIRSTGGPPDMQKVLFFWNLVPARGGRRTFEYAAGNAERICTSENGFETDQSPFELGSAKILEDHSFRLAEAFMEAVCKLNNDIIHPDYA